MSQLPLGAASRAAKPAPGSREAPYSIRQLSRRIRQAVENAFRPGWVWVKGEVLQASRPASGHVYLSFKEESAVLEGVIWSGTRRRLHYLPKRGDRVLAEGRVTTFEGRSRYQLIIERVERAGEGHLLGQLKALEARLEREGLFDPARKKTLPFLPRRVGLLSSVGSDAWKDFHRHAMERFPGLEIADRDTRVQGSRAAADLVAGIRWLGTRDLDLIVVARGGGSTEDLLPFSDERVLRAASACPLSLVSAVGHEADHPLLDRVADYRAATPTAAAKEVIRDAAALAQELQERRGAARHAARHALSAAAARLEGGRSHRATQALPALLKRESDARRADRQRIRERAEEAIAAREKRLGAARRRLREDHPHARLRSRQRGLAELREAIDHPAPLEAAGTAVAALGNRAASAHWSTVTRVGGELQAAGRQAERIAAFVARALDRLGGGIEVRRGQLHDRNPRRVLEQGYSLALNARGRPIRAAATVAAGARVRLLLGQGELGVRVEEVDPGKSPTGPPGDRPP